MATPFSRTLRSVEADGLGRAFLGGGLGRAAAGSVLVALWCGWATCARVAVYAETDAARVEARGAAHRVQAEVDGVVVEVHGELGGQVRAGDVLVALDPSDLRAGLGAATARRASLDTQREGLVEQLARTEAARVDREHVATAAVAEAKAQLRSADAERGLAADEAAQARSMWQEKVGSAADASRAEALAAQTDGARAAAAHRLELLTWDGRLSRAEQLAREAALKREIALIDAEIAGTDAEVAQAERALKRRAIAAPVDGVIAERAPLGPGAVVRVGDTVASVVPSGALQVVAQFAPAGVGRVAAGQRAILHLDGFSWVEYGTVPAVVRSVAAEPRDGSIRVELDVDPDAAASIGVALRHGLSGALYVEVERVSPARLLVRSVVGARPGGA